MVASNWRNFGFKALGQQLSTTSLLQQRYYIEWQPVFLRSLPDYIDETLVDGGLGVLSSQRARYIAIIGLDSACD